MAPMGLGIGLGISMGGGGVVAITPPAALVALGWTPVVNVFRGPGGAITHDFNPATIRPASGKTYYVDPAKSDNLGAGTSWTTALRDVGAAVVKSDVDSIIIRDGRYIGGYGWANAVATRGIDLQPETNAGADFIAALGRTPPTWALDQGSTYYTPNTNSIASTGVFDMATLDQDGMALTHVRAASLAACRTTPGSYWGDGVNTYATAADGRSLVGDQNMFVSNPNNVIRWEPTSSSMKLCLKNIRVHGGSRPLYINAPTLAPTVLLDTCEFSNAALNNGTNISMAGVVYAYRCKSGGNYQDGLNWHGQVAGTPSTPSPDIYEIECKVGRNGYNTPTNSTNNATTAHESCRILRVNSIYRTSEGRVCADIDNVISWSLGCSFGPSLATDSAGQSVQAASSNPHWMDTCSIAKGPASVDVSISVSGGLRIYNTSLAGLAVDQPTYVQSY